MGVLKLESHHMKRLRELQKAHPLWEISITRGTHLRFSRPGCPPVFASYTPSDWRADKDLARKLRLAERSCLTSTIATAA